VVHVLEGCMWAHVFEGQADIACVTRRGHRQRIWHGTAECCDELRLNFAWGAARKYGAWLLHTALPKGPTDDVQSAHGALPEITTHGSCGFCMRRCHRACQAHHTACAQEDEQCRRLAEIEEIEGKIKHLQMLRQQQLQRERQEEERRQAMEARAKAALQKQHEANLEERKRARAEAVAREVAPHERARLQLGSPPKQQKAQGQPQLPMQQKQQPPQQQPAQPPKQQTALRLPRPPRKLLPPLLPVQLPPAEVETQQLQLPPCQPQAKKRLPKKVKRRLRELRTVRVHKHAYELVLHYWITL